MKNGKLLSEGPPGIRTAFPERIRLRVLILTTGFALIAAALTAFLLRHRRAPELLCWNCNGRIDENSALLRCTGNCPHCGQRAVKDA